MESSSSRQHRSAESVARSSSISADRLKQALKDLEIVVDTHDGYGLALVSVWVGLVVWCDGERFWWRSGWDERRSRVVYAWHPAAEPHRAARRIAARYAHLRERHPLPHPMTGVPL